jgi:hypothetical protein
MVSYNYINDKADYEANYEGDHAAVRPRKRICVGTHT